jgi:hypothetical protein
MWGLDGQDTIKAPKENYKMKKATALGIATTTFFYAAIGLIGYAAFGNDAPGNLLSGCDACPRPCFSMVLHSGLC